MVVGAVLGLGGVKSTLCGLWAGRHVEVFKPSEASCRECRKRYQLAMAKQAALTPAQRKAQADQQSAQQVAGCLLIVILIIAIGIAAAVHYS